MQKNLNIFIIILAVSPSLNAHCRKHQSIYMVAVQNKQLIITGTASLLFWYVIRRYLFIFRHSH